MKAEILCVGTEILLGDIVNTNAAFLAKELASLGIGVYHQSVVGDNPQRLEKSLREALEQNDIVITSGGLGPTYDDLTKETAAKLLGLELVEDEPSRQNIEQFLRLSGRKVTPTLMKQALLPQGATALKNNHGTAPGVYVEQNGKVLIMLPGPPSEIQPMFTEQAVPLLKKLTGKTIVSHTVYIIGVGESTVETTLHKMMTHMTNPTVAPYAKTGQVQVRVTAFADSADEAEQMTQPVIAEILEKIGTAYHPNGYAYGVDVENIQTALVQKLKEKHLKIATAESLTGGLISKLITEVSGASEVLECGVCSYSNRIKHEILGVRTETLDTYTEYSLETAKEMAEGVRKLSGADIGISTTGIAGPSGGTAEKPIGTVYIGISTKNRTKSMEFHFGRGFKSERETIRELAAINAVSMALGEINENL